MLGFFRSPTFSLFADVLNALYPLSIQKRFRRETFGVRIYPVHWTFRQCQISVRHRDFSIEYNEVPGNVYSYFVSHGGT